MNAGMIASSNQHRRRISMPSTPPETPLDGYFDRKQLTAPLPTPSHSTHITIYPDSPPITPERRLEAQEVKLSESEKRKEKGKGKESTVLPTHGPRRPSIAYAHHRRTSTATIVRLAAAKQGIILTPSKVLSLFLIFFSAVYLASFLPGPLNSLLHRRTPQLPKKSAPIYYSPPTVSGALNNKPLQRTMPIGETAQRRAWEDSFPHRIPPQQHVVPVKHDADNLARSYHGDLYRAHPELLISNTGSQARRRPLRFGKAAANSEPDKVDRRANSDSSDDTSFDDASHSPRQAAVPAERQAQINRMKKMAVAKQNTAKVGSSAPLDSSEVTTGEERIHVDGASSARRKVKKVNSGSKEKDEGRLPQKDSKKREAGKPRLGRKDRQVVDHETRGSKGAGTVDEWAELEDSRV
ncbi:hypothetical protein JCM3765_004523 [Sporobolomyces pararoseus]